jgi:hypothetical protein
MEWMEVNKISITQYATAVYNRQSYDAVLKAVQNAINRAADGYLSNVSLVTSAYIATLNDSIILVDATSGAITVTLPAASDCEQKRFTIKKTDISANAVTIDGNGAETIDGAATKTLSTQYKSYELIAHGGSWWIVSAI